MSNKFFLKTKAVAAAAALLLGTASLAGADTITYDLSYEYSGSESPESAETPWLRATLDDAGGSGSVTLTLESLNLVEEEHVKIWAFNYSDDLDLDLLSVSYESGSSPLSISQVQDGKKADGGGLFDIWFEWATGAFGARETAVFSFTSSEAITVASFDVLSTVSGGNGVWATAAHVGGIDCSDGEDEGSGWIGAVNDDNIYDPPPNPVPEPATVLLLGTGLLGVYGVRKSRKK